MTTVKNLVPRRDHAATNATGITSHGTTPTKTEISLKFAGPQKSFDVGLPKKYGMTVVITARRGSGT
jgi:hypothetical protein